MNRVFLQLLILVMLEKPMYGYMIVKELNTKNFSLEENTLYPLLRRLEKQNLLISDWIVNYGKPKKYYRISEAGK